MIFSTDSNLSILGLFSVFVLLTMSCTPMTRNSTSTDDQSNAWQTIEGNVESLERTYERENSLSFTRQIHPDYERFRSDLRSQLSDVFRTYQSIRLNFFGPRANRSDGRIEVLLRWDLNWTCQNPPSGGTPNCSSNADVGEIIKRTGRTQLSFSKDDGDWKLLNQRSDVLFGALRPGSL